MTGRNPIRRKPGRLSSLLNAAAGSPGPSSILAGAALVYFLFPHHQPEQDLLARYHAQDSGTPAPA